MRTIIFLVCLFIFSFFSRCKKNEIKTTIQCTDPIQDSVNSKSLMSGTWNWVSEYYVQPFTGNILLKTPSTEGYTKKLIFLNDKELQFFQDNIPKGKFKYNIEREKIYTNFPADSSYVLVFKDYNTGQLTNYVFFTICSNTLTLNYQYISDTKGQEVWSK